MLKTPFTDFVKSFSEDENEGCYFFPAWGVLFFFRADENAVNLHETRVLFFFRVRGAMSLPRGRNERCYFFSAWVLKTPFTDFVKCLFRRRPFLCELRSRPSSERQACGGPKTALPVSGDVRAICSTSFLPSLVPSKATERNSTRSLKSSLAECQYLKHWSLTADIADHLPGIRRCSRCLP